MSSSSRSVMVQPYLTRLDGEGATGLVYLDGAPLVLEVELTEPSLNLPVGPGAARRLVAALTARL